MRLKLTTHKPVCIPPYSTKWPTCFVAHNFTGGAFNVKEIAIVEG